MLVLLSFPLVVLGGSQEGNITLLLVHHPETGGNGKFDVELDGSISSTNCGTNAWSAELDTGAAEAQYATITKEGRIEGTEGGDGNYQHGNWLKQNPTFCFKMSYSVLNMCEEPLVLLMGIFHSYMIK